jgi:outer membrane receptor protein involved in Fe transport
MHQTTEYIVQTDSNLNFDARLLGFQDVVDPTTGQVIYPAEAFLYGGKAYVNLPDGLKGQFNTRNGAPEEQYGINASWQITPKLGFNAGVTHYSESVATRVAAIKLPATTLLNAGMTWDTGSWRFQVNASNVTDERYFRPRNGDTQYIIMSSMPGRSYAFTIKHDFM